MEKIWYRQYEKGVPEDINIKIDKTLLDEFEYSCQRYRNRIAFSNFKTKLTFDDLEIKSRAFAAYLQTKLKLSKNDRIAIMLPNILQYPITMFGALRAGLTVINVNPLYTARELKHQLQDSNAQAIVILENFVVTLQDIIVETSVKHTIVTQIGDLLSFPQGNIINFYLKYIKKAIPAWKLATALSLTTVLNIGENLSYKNPAIKSTDIAYLQYTGGTTGISKGAMLTHSNILSNVAQARAWIRSKITSNGEIIITALPLYHIFSLTANCLTFMFSGAENVLITDPKNIKTFIKLIKSIPFTAITGVNTLFSALLDNVNFSSLNFSSLKITLGGGMAVHHSVAKRWKAITEKPLLEAYGLTETSPAVCMTPTYMTEFTGSVGLPIPSTEISIRDKSNMELNIDEVGELWVRGPQVMKGYWQSVEETKKVLTADGWLKTGDIARVDSKGFVYIVDRKKDIIVISGFNVYPNEIENVLTSHELIVECAVVGIQDEIKGEVIKAFIIRKNDSLTAEEVIRFCKKELTPYKIPKEIEFRDMLPKTNVGKILRKDLK